MGGFLRRFTSTTCQIKSRGSDAGMGMLRREKQIGPSCQESDHTVCFPGDQSVATPRMWHCFAPGITYKAESHSRL